MTTTVPAPADGARRRPDGRPGSLYAELSAQVQAAGLMRRRYGYYWARFAALLGALAAVLVGSVLVGHSWWQLVLAAVLGVVVTQVAFLGHDAAHRQIFASGRWNDWATLVLAPLLTGISASWWVRKHTKHHAAPNQVGTDPDIAPGALVFHPGALVGRSRLGRALAARQGWLFFPLLLLEGLNLHVQGVRALCARGPVKRRWVELSFITVRLGGYLALLAWLLPPGIAAAFLGVQLAVFGLYMGCSFAPNHKGMPVVPEGVRLDFLRRQVLMSRNVSGGRFTTFALGGLNHQVEHHLFPSMPRPALRRARQLVRPFCARHEVTYTETSLVRSYGIVVRHLNEVGLGARDPFECPLVTSWRPRG